ncbi:MAG: orotidine-5'-phosphate decarboxylase [Gammaproteobacteria bacterium]|jgi:orotidine-5'-phosphate decarboxylase|nr:orotidine-5'-phosphate decarboxylase [Gammaproteobacteria bacterium]
MNRAAEGRRIIVALDYPDPAQALRTAERLDPAACRLKVGKELFTRGGPSLVEQLQRRDFAVFLDLKFHDIPNTVAAACRAAGALGVWMLNVHAQGGRHMMEAAREALGGFQHPPLLIAVTVLTSLGATELKELGHTESPETLALRLAALARSAGLDGVVCSAQEAAALKKANGDDFVLVTPGIRPVGTSNDDQQRVMTPAAALAAGSDYLVIGRPITAAADPLVALQGIRRSIGEQGAD